MKVKLIIPGWPVTSIWRSCMFRFPYLSLTTLAALTPEPWEIQIADENVAPLDFDDGPDLVGITALTPLAPRAYEIAREYRKRGAKVVMGGFHASWIPEEANEHVDSVVVGEAETLWPSVLDDFARDSLRPYYRSETPGDFPSLPPARRDLLNRKAYLFVNTMQTTRGCPFDCQFCSVTSFYGHTYRLRPLDEVDRELQTISGGANFLFIVDDNIVGNIPYAKKLFTLLKRYPFKWLSQATVTFAENPDLLKLAQESGCCGMFLGFESLSQEALDKVNKRFGRVDKYAEVIRKIHDHGIGIQGSFIFGNDWDTLATFDEVLEFTQRAKLESALYTILTPFPGTKVYRAMEEEGRLLSRDWTRYDMAHCVFRPKNMTPEALEENFVRINRKFHSVGSMLTRLPLFSRRIQVFGPMNWAFHKVWNEVGH
jgi:radical SAM superfamily enzyme YgiQ (UPF0313 family)